MILRAREARNRLRVPVETPEDGEIDRAARAMLANHGANAAQEAERRSTHLTQCALDGQAAKWHKIALIIRRFEEHGLKAETSGIHAFLAGRN